MKREDLIAMGLSEENADKIMADYGSSVQKAKAKVDEYKAKADKAEELQKQLDDIEQESSRKSSRQIRTLKKPMRESRNLKKRRQ